MSYSTIHAYFVLRSVFYSWLNSKSATCPHCNGDLSNKKNKQRATSQHSSGASSKESYHEAADQEATVGLNDEDYQEPRASTDDENERLIATAE